MSSPTTETSLQVLVLSTYPPDGGGGEMQTLAQVRALVRRGNAITVIDLRPRRRSETFDREDPIPVHRIRVPDVPLLRGIVFHLRLIGLVLRHFRKVDVVHFNHIGSALVSAGLVLGLLKIPRVVVIWGSAVPGVGPFEKGWKWSLARSVARRFEHCVSLATSVTANLTRAGFDPSRISMIPNGVDGEAFFPKGTSEADVPRTGFNTRDLQVVCVGRLVPAKGLELLLEAWKTVQVQHRGATLLVAGNGPLRESLEEITRRLEIARSVRFLGMVTDIPELLRSCDVYVSASRTEGMSNALLEAMACGLPIVATTVGAAPDLIEDGRSGLLVPPGDVGALAAAISKVLEDDTLRRSAGNLGRVIVERSLSLEAIAARYEDLYRSLSSSRRHPHSTKGQ